MTDTTSARSSRRSFWAEHLEGAPAVLPLPSDRPRPSTNEVVQGVASVTSTLSGARVDALRRLAAPSGAGLYGAVLAGWSAVLARDTDETDLVLGCWSVPGAVPGSLHVLRQRVDLAQTFTEHLVRTSAALSRTSSAGAVTVDELCTLVGVEPGRGKHPFFQVGLAEAGDGDVLEGTAGGTAPCDMVLRWSEGPDEVRLRLDYRPQLFDETRAVRVLDRLLVLLAGAAADPDRPVGRLEVLTPQERALLASWNSTEAPHDADATLYGLFAAQVDRTPDAVAVELHGVRLTYQDLDRHACALAARLAEQGVGPDVRVAVSMERSVELAVAVLAVLAAGGAYVPVDPTYPSARKEYMVTDSQAHLVLRRGWAGEPLGRSSGVEIVVLDEIDPSVPPPAVARPATGTRGEHLGYVVYTSGSTGQPKGVALPQRALTNLVRWQLGRPDFEPGARTVQYSSLSFDVSCQELFTTWCSGGTLVLVDDVVRRDSRGLLDHLVEQDVERVFMPFVALRGLAEAALSTGTLPQRLREVYTAGEQLQVDDTVRSFFRRLDGCLLENQYGPSESHVVSAHRLQGPAEGWPPLPPIGSPIANVAVHVLDAERGLRPVGVPGELYVEGVCLARGYLGRPDLTAERFLDVVLDGRTRRVYRTGDLARWTEGGDLEFLGRTDDQVKFRGFRIEPGEVGAVLSGFPGVKHCVAVVADVPDVGPRLAAYVVASEGERPGLEELHRYAQDRLPDYMVPSHVTLLDELPLTSSGKIDLKALPTPTFDRGILSVPYRAATTTEEKSLVQLWERLLGVDRIGVDDDFFELGGDSLLAVALFAEVHERFGRELPLGALAESPTVAGLAAHLGATEQADSWGALVPLRVTGSRRPLFCIHGGFGNVASFPLLARALPDDQPVYALQWDGLAGREGARSIEQMAARYLVEVRKVQPQGPYRFAGQCIGGLIGREMTRQLQQQGEDVELLVMYDSPNLYSDDFRLHARLPAVPKGLRRQVLAVVGPLNTVRRFAVGARPRRRILRVQALSVLGRTVPAGKDREHFGSQVMVRAAWRYRVRFLHHVTTLYLHSGISTGSRIALVGRWNDGMMGWSAHLTSHFTATRVESDHNAVPYDPESVRLVSEALAGLGTEHSSGVQP